MSQKNVRSNNVELFRMIAAIGVIIIHVKSGSTFDFYLTSIFLPICVPYFFSISVYFFIRNCQKVSLKNLLLKILNRIAIPYLSWTLIYLMLFYLKLITVGSHVKLPLFKAIFFGESAVQLYYLTSLIALEFLILFLVYIRKQDSSKSDKYLALGIGIFSIIHFSLGAYYGVAGVRNLIYIIGYVNYIGIGFYDLYIQYKKIKNIYWIILLLVIEVIFLLNIKDSRYFYPAIAPFVGYALLKLSINLKEVKLPNFILSTFGLSYGIYLSHIIFLEIIEFILEKTILIPSDFVFLLKPFVVCLVGLMAIIFVRFIKKIKILSYLLLGD